MAHVLEYYHEFRDKAGVVNRVELLLEGYSGGATLIEKSARVPVRMRHTGAKTGFENTIIQGQELVFSFYVPRDDVDTLDSIFESDYKDYKLRYYIGGSSGWFLPSKDELNAMYINLHLEGVGDFANDKYWSSTEDNSLNSWANNFTTGTEFATSKISAFHFHVRACHSFTAPEGAYSLRDTGPAGGLIFYIDRTTYLEAAPSNQSISQVWSNVQVEIGITSADIGEGQNNTNEIIAQAGHTNSAAKLCSDLGDPDIGLIFEGYVKPENLSKQFLKTPPNIQITLSATDALGDLRSVDFGDGTIINDKLTLLEILKHALTPIDINLDFQVQLGTYENDYMVSTECALKEISVDTRRFFEWKTGKRVHLSCWQVIEAVLKDFSVTFKQHKGKYQITCHRELNSYQFLYDWTTLTQQSRTTTANIIDLAAYKFDPAIEQQKSRPLKTAKIIFRNKDLGGDVSGMDLDDWNNGAVWTIDFSDGFSVAAGVVTLDSDDNTYDEYIETAVFTINKVTDNDFLKITFDHILFAHTSPDPLKAPLIKITITRPDASTEDTYFNCRTYWDSYESDMYKAFKVIASGEYKVRLSFEQKPGPSQWTTASFKIKNFTATKIITSSEEEELENVTYDELYEQTSGQGVEVFETETILADGGQVTEVGALLYIDSAEHNTGLWRSYGHTEDIKLLDIYARYILNDRYSYKNYIRPRIYDLDNNISFDNILMILGKNYVFISYDRDFKSGFITTELVELLTTQESYSDISRGNLNSIDGERVSTSVNVTYVNASALPPHNELSGLYGAAPYNHLSAAAYTNVGNLDTMAYVSAGDYYTKVELDGGQLDNRYYTETEINTWRNSVTEQEMGWLHGITSDVQTQITARAIIGANPADDRLCTWSSTTTIQGEANLTFNGSILRNWGSQYRQYSTEAGKTDWRITINTIDADLASIYSYDEGETALRNMVFGNETNFLYLDLANTRVGVNRNDPSYTLDVNGDARITGDFYLSDLNNNNQLITTDANGKLISESNLTFDGNELINKSHLYKQYSTEAGKTDWRFTISMSDADLTKIFNYDEGETAFRNMVLGNLTDFLYLDLANTRVGVNRNDPSYTFDVNGTGRFTGIFYLSGIGTTASGEQDSFLFWDSAAGKITKANINDLPADASPDGAADYVVTYDNSATTHKKVLLENLPTASGVMMIKKAEILFSNTNQTTIITLPTNAVIWKIAVEITTIFNGSGTDLLDVGITGEGDKYDTDVSLTATTWRSISIGLIARLANRMTDPTNITFQYFDENSDATEGTAYIYVHYSLH